MRITRRCAGVAWRTCSGRASRGTRRDRMTSDGVTSSSPAWSRWLWLSVAVIALDQLTKHWVVAGIRPGEEYPMTSFFSLVLAFNRGMAFSFLANADGWQRWLFIVVALIASAVMLWL